MDNDAVAQWEQTEQLPASERYEAWHHMLNRVYGTWEMEKQTGSVFDARMKSRAVGGFQVVECVCDPCGATRTKTKISKSGREAITIPLILSGRANITMGNKLVQLRAGDVLILEQLAPPAVRDPGADAQNHGDGALVALAELVAEQLARDRGAFAACVGRRRLDDADRRLALVRIPSR